MENSDKFKQWQETQEHWDDTEFLANEANALMKKRWLRLNNTVSKITADEVVLRNEYVNFLDIGAGRGDFYRLVSDMVKKYKGLEPSVEMLKDEIKDEEFEIKRGTGEELNEENLYDVCLLKEVLDHTYEPERVLQNAYKALKDGGLIIVTLTNKDSYYKLIFRKKAKELIEKNRDHINNFNQKEAAGLLEKAGFKIEKNISTNYLKLPWGLEEAIGKRGDKAVFSILDITDKIFSALLPGKGGSFIITARKGRAPGGEA